MKKFIWCIGCCLVFIACEKDMSLNDSVENHDCVSSSSVKIDKAVVLVLGQSNAANFGESRYTASCQSLSSFYEGQLYPLKDPLLGANGTKGSVWSRLGDVLMKNSFANQIIIAPVAVGATSIEQWTPPFGEYNHLIVDAISSIEASGHKITHVLWHQGESNNATLSPDINPVENAELYQHNFLLLSSQIRALGVDAPIFVSVATRCGNTKSIDTVLQLAQYDLAQNEGVFNGPNTDLLDNEFRYDNCHFSDEGLLVHAELWADILLSH